MSGYPHNPLTHHNLRCANGKYSPKAWNDVIGWDVLSVSTDTIDTHVHWLTAPPSQGGIAPLAFPFASDPEGEVCKAYGVLVERGHLALRGLFIIDPNGALQCQVVHNLSVGRCSDEILRVLDGLQSGGMCAAERSLGQPPLDILDHLGPNRVIGQYQVESLLGSGAFGVVYRARDLVLGLITYEMLTGKPAISGNSMLEVLTRIEQFDADTCVAGLSEPFAGILRDSLARQPTDRHVTMAQIAERLA